MGGIGFCRVCLNGTVTVTGLEPITVADVCVDLPITNGVVTIDVASILATFFPQIPQAVIDQLRAAIGTFTRTCPFDDIIVDEDIAGVVSVDLTVSSE
ncbi:hypothetical protein [Ammoniphilus sp. YIM 78166]|uniref:hypothetical protein n=1 Tax=Ammoniphilus sp. YIM 78166 TaxID=1644106 RepID=UPI00106FA010|nr:hypothetical protein [Ammoniphilus sp. YIM 78166]